jgi:SAM-dependent methyltransferase
VWSWDETLYRGSAEYYARGRFPYPQELADALCDALPLDGTGQLLDVGCGPGPLTLLLAPLFEHAIGLDADADMVSAARREAVRKDVTNAQFIQLRAEELPADLGVFRVVTFAQSFHWMDQPRVAAAVKTMLESEGAWVHVHGTTHQGAGEHAGLPAPRPPHGRIQELVRAYLGPVRRAGVGMLPEGTPRYEEDVMAAAGYRGPTRLEVGGSRVLERTEDDIVASVYSRSSSTPHLFGERLKEFEAELRGLLRRVAPDGRFSERAGKIELVIWKPGASG